MMGCHVWVESSGSVGCACHHAHALADAQLSAAKSYRLTPEAHEFDAAVQAVYRFNVC